MLISNPQTDTIFEHLSNNRLNVVLIAENSEMDVNAFIAEANNRGVRIAGGIFPMIIHEDKYIDKGVIIKKLDADSETFIIPVGDADVVEDLPDLTSSINSCILFLDGLMTQIPKFLEGLYEKYWDSVSFFGAGCGSLTLKQTPCVFSNDGLFQDVGLMITVTDKMNLGVQHGWEKITGPLIANKTENNKIIELNWRPAFEVYREIVEQHSNRSFDDEEFFDISQGYAFGIYKEEGEDIVRDPISVDENNVITCIGQVKENVSLNILHGNKQNLINCAGGATKSAFEGVEADDFLVVDCISRVLYLGNDFIKELKSVKDASTIKNKDLEGVLSLGEISSVEGGFLEFYNKTIVVAAFYA